MIRVTLEITDNEKGGDLVIRHHHDSPTKGEELMAANLKKVLLAWVRIQTDAHEGVMLGGVDSEAEADRLIAVIQQKRDEIGWN